MTSKWIAPLSAIGWTALATTAFIAAAYLQPHRLGPWDVAFSTARTSAVFLLTALAARKTWNVSLGLAKVPNTARAFLSVLWLASASLAIDAVASLFALGDHEAQARLVLAFRNMPWLTFWISALAVAILPAVSEELLFRGAIAPYLRRESGARVSIVTTSILFGAIHLAPVQGTQAAILGLVLHTIAAREGLLVSIFAHGLNNFAFACLARANLTPAPVPTLAASSVVFLLASFALQKKPSRGNGDL